MKKTTVLNNQLFVENTKLIFIFTIDKNGGNGNKFESSSLINLLLAAIKTMKIVSHLCNFYFINPDCKTLLCNPHLLLKYTDLELYRSSFAVIFYPILKVNT